MKNKQKKEKNIFIKLVIEKALIKWIGFSVTIF